MNYKNEDRTLLILDLDETLIHARKEKLGYKEDFEIFGYYIYKRPFLDEFLEEVQKDFLIAIWSSASDDYVQRVTEEIVSSEISLEFVWGRSRCTLKRNWDINNERIINPNRDHHHYTKPLKKLKRQGYKIERILIVDDSPHKSKENYGNAIYPIEFLGDSNDKELDLLLSYLKKLKDKSNVRGIEKRRWRSQID